MPLVIPVGTFAIHQGDVYTTFHAGVNGTRDFASIPTVISIDSIQPNEQRREEHGSLIAILSRISVSLDAPKIRINDCDNPANSAVVRLRPSFAALLSSACVHLSATHPACLFWCDSNSRHELTHAGYADFMLLCS